MGKDENIGCRIEWERDEAGRDGQRNTWTTPTLVATQTQGLHLVLLHLMRIKQGNIASSTIASQSNASTLGKLIKVRGMDEDTQIGSSLTQVKPMMLNQGATCCKPSSGWWG